MARGWSQGFPKKLGEVWVTRTYNLQTVAAPAIAAGSRFGATCTARGRQIAHARVTLEQPRHAHAADRRPVGLGAC